MNTSFFGELLQTHCRPRPRAASIARATARGDAAQRSETLIELCEHLLSGRGEASGVALAREILDTLRRADRRPAHRVLRGAGAPLRPRSRRASTPRSRPGAPRRPTTTAADLHDAAEPRRQELFRRLNLAPGGTAALVRMREQLLDALDHRDDLAAVDADFVHLFSSWFNRGFLVLRRIDWSTPAIDPGKDHPLRGGARHPRLGRPAPPHRSAGPALLRVLPSGAGRRAADLRRGGADARDPGAIAPILDPQARAAGDPDEATTAVFYSISNCQRGLAGVSFGNFLIKQVVEEISREFPQLSTFVTLSPVPRFRRLARARAQRPSIPALLAERSRGARRARRARAGGRRGGCRRRAARADAARRRELFPARAQSRAALPLDPVARFHLGNGARLERLNWPRDLSERGIKQAYGLMVNYLYDLDDIEQNHEAYAEHRTIVAAPAIVKLARNMELVAVNK